MVWNKGLRSKTIEEKRKQKTEYMRKYRAKNKEKIKRQRIKWNATYRRKYPERVNLSIKKSKSKKPELYSRHTENWRQKNRHKANAEQQARRKMKIPKNQICQICNERLATQRHHSDYNNPLEVVFVDSQCHGKIHRRVN